MRFFLGGFWATGEPWSTKSDQFWVDIFKPKWNLSYIDGARLRGSEEDACVSPLWRDNAAKFFTSPVFSSVSFASYPKSFWESDLCKKGPLKAIRPKKNFSQRTNNGTFDFSTFLIFSTDKILLNGHFFSKCFLTEFKART